MQYEETLKPSYISVDLSEVELAEYDGPSHSLNNSVLLDVSFASRRYSYCSVWSNVSTTLFLPPSLSLFPAEARHDRSEGRRNGLCNQNALRWYGELCRKIIAQTRRKSFIFYNAITALKSSDLSLSVNLQKRVTIRRHNYFYKPIDGTPFSLGLALPEGYGMFELRAEKEIKHAIINGKLSVCHLSLYHCMMI